jgi:hypothetical protein
VTPFESPANEIPGAAAPATATTNANPVQMLLFIVSSVNE